MKFLLFLIILALCGGGYYEHTILQQKRAAQAAVNQKQIDDLNGKIDQIKVGNKKLQSYLDAANQILSGAKSRLADLTAQLQTMQNPAENAQKTSEVKPAPVSSNFLGAIATLDGKTYQNCHLLKVEADGITFEHSDGIAKVTFMLLPPNLEKKFGFNIRYETELPPDDVQAQEDLRIEADRQSAAQNPAPTQPAEKNP